MKESNENLLLSWKAFTYNSYVPQLVLFLEFKVFFLYEDELILLWCATLLLVYVLATVFSWDSWLLHFAILHGSLLSADCTKMEGVNWLSAKFFDHVVL